MDTKKNPPGAASPKRAMVLPLTLAIIARIRTLLKAVIVRLALWGVLPVALAEWVIHRGGMRDV